METSQLRFFMFMNKRLVLTIVYFSGEREKEKRAEK